MACATGGLPAGLLEEIKAYLDCDWVQPGSSEEIKLVGLTRDGIAYLNDKLGTAGDYMSPGYPRTLLKEYVRYARDAALDVFENNYRSLLLAMQTQRQVAAAAAEEDAQA